MKVVDGFIQKKDKKAHTSKNTPHVGNIFSLTNQLVITLGTMFSNLTFSSNGCVLFATIASCCEPARAHEVIYFLKDIDHVVVAGAGVPENVV